jgi:pimeloyl-ACP methyl ester carboxylesterase
MEAAMRFRHGLTGWALLGAACVLAPGTASAQTVTTTASPPPTEAACPDFLPQQARCWSGRAAKGGYYWIAVPENWNGSLIVHAHGGPRTGEPKADDPLEDLERFSMMVKEGFAWAGSTYRRGGYGVRMAAEDTDDLRQIFWDTFGRPHRTILHGQSWGGNVAAKAAELYARDAEGQVVWDGVVLTSGVLAGGTEAYKFRADLRAVYQYYCQNHPKPDEVQYPVWQGLPEGVRLTRAQLAERVKTCTGVGLPEAVRSPEQKQRLADILNVVGVQEDQLVAHLAWGTFLFQDLVQRRLDGLNPFSNIDTVYAGSHDDAALNVGVERFNADPMAVARLAYDADLTGLIVAPTLTIHGKGDPTAFVWHGAAYRDRVAAAGRSDLLVQTFTNEASHSALSAPEYVAVFEALMGWIEQGSKPDTSSVAALCEAARSRYKTACLFDEGFAPIAP